MRISSKCNNALMHFHSTAPALAHVDSEPGRGGRGLNARISPADQGAGTAVRLPGTICAWKAKTSRLLASTDTFSQFTSLLPFA